MIDSSYSTNYDLKKETKTGKSRTIWLKSRAAEIIRKLRCFYQSIGQECKGQQLVFQKQNGKGFNSDDMRGIWHKSNVVSGVAKLVQEGKLPQYLNSYSTRRTFCSLQARLGEDSMTIATYVGNNVETIHKYYFQSRRVDGAVLAKEETE